MRRIKITAEIEQLSNKYALELLNDKEKDSGVCRYVENLKQLRDNIAKPTTVFMKGRGEKLQKFKPDKDLKKRYIAYVENIICRYNKLNNLHPKKWDKYISDFEGILSVDELKVIIKFRKKKPMRFYDHIIRAMDFDRIREVIFKKYIKHKSLDFRTCVYCNAQFAVTSVPEPSFIKVEMKRTRQHGARFKYIPTKYGATYDIDHNKPKSKYPFLCTNFFNLLPVCPNCNRRKNNDEVEFNVYSWDNIEERPLHFELDPKDIIDFVTNDRCDNMYPKLKDKTDGAGLAKAFNEKFHIDAIYKELTDEVEELLWRVKIYNDSGRNILMTQYPNLHINNFDIDRFIHGTYMNHKDAFKRPLTIMKQDIYEQIRKRNKQ